jgi:hypothetical protein
MIYSGQELPNHKRLLFFDKDEIPWTGECALHSFYKTLLGLRKRNPALRGGDPAVVTRRIGTHEGWRFFGFVRSLGDHIVIVLLNLSGESLSVPAGDLGVNGGFREVFTGAEMDPGNGGQLNLGPWGYQVLERK